MHIKIQGGGTSNYANKGSCSDCVDYLDHEDLELMNRDNKMEFYFNNERDNITSAEVINSIDNNKQALGKDDAKFFVITVSPSDEELKSLGESKDQHAQLKEYVNEKLMQSYAEGFNKNLNVDDIMYYAKIHHERDKSINEKENAHIHIIVSRKSKNGKMKLSPQTNHKNSSKGAVKGGFNRSDFFQKAESNFDAKFKYDRDVDKSYKYLNAMKNGSLEEQKKMISEFNADKQAMNKWKKELELLKKGEQRLKEALQKVAEEKEKQKQMQLSNQDTKILRNQDTEILRNQDTTQPDNKTTVQQNEAKQKSEPNKKEPKQKRNNGLKF